MQAVLIFPALLLVLMLIVQTALYLHSGAVAEAAAQDAAAAARLADGTTTAATAAGNRSLSALGPRMLTDATVTVTRTATTASATVTGHVVSLVPGMTLPVRETATGPVERFVPTGAAP